MKKEGTTIPFLVSYKSGKSETLEAVELDDLIAEHFTSKEEFEKKASLVQWKKKSTQCIYDVSTGETGHKISDGDVNPFGWRQKHK